MTTYGTRSRGPGFEPLRFQIRGMTKILLSKSLQFNNSVNLFKADMKRYIQRWTFYLFMSALKTTSYYRWSFQ